MALATRLLLLVALAVAPALVIVGIDEFQLRQSREAEVRQLAQRTVNDATTEVRNVVRTAQQLSAVVAKLPEVLRAAQGTAFSEECAVLLRSIQQDSPGGLDFGIANKDGLVICTARGTTTRRLVGDHLRRAMEANGFVVGSFAEVQNPSGRYLSFAYPVRDAAGAPIGGVLAGLDLRWLSRELANRFARPDTVLSLHDRDLRYMVRVPDEAGLIGAPPPPSVRALERFANQGAIEAQGADGVRRVGAINTVILGQDNPNRPDLSVAFGLSADAALQEVEAASMRGLGLLLMSGLLAAAAATYGGRRFIARPVEQLLSTAKHWRQGEYRARVNLPERSSELGRLATAYEEMADALAAREEERAKAEQNLRASEERLRLSQEAGGIGFWDWNIAANRIVWSESLRRLWAMPSNVEASYKLFLEHVHPDDRETAEQHTRGVMRGEHPFDLELRSVAGRWIAAKGELITDPESSRALRMIGTCQDITERKRAEERQRLLINELNHRVKNTLAIVQSIAFQSLKSARVGDSPGQSFEARLLALAKTHDVLTRENWASASLRALVAETIAPYAGGASERFSVAGEDLRLPPAVVVPLSMALHELCTNAAKYGALSNSAGHVAIDWRVRDVDGAQRLLLEWDESGGPAVAEPASRGFGSRLIEHGLARQLAGDVQLRFECEGVRCTIDIPIDPPATPSGAEAA